MSKDTFSRVEAHNDMQKKKKKKKKDRLNSLAQISHCLEVKRYNNC